MLKVEKSLWPLTVWMRIFGFHMGPRKKRTNSSRYSGGLLAAGSLMVLSTIGLHFTSFVLEILKLRVNGIGPNGTNVTTANLLNTGIEHLNNTWLFIGVHVSFFFVSLTTNWKTLWNSLLLMEKNLKFNSDFHRKCRKSVSVGFALLLIVILDRL